MLKELLMIDRYNAIQRGVHAEEIANKVLKGTITRSVGYDLTIPKYKVEVRSRCQNTDGPIPRATVTKTKMHLSDFIVFIQYKDNIEKSIDIGVILHTKSLMALYKNYLQKNGSTAHIPLKKILKLSHIDMTSRLIIADNNFKESGLYL